MNPTPDVSSRFGAPMGRPNREPNHYTNRPIKFRLVRLRINSGGYDAGGAYWGTGQPLYYAEGVTAPDDESDIELEFSRYFRADNREHAKRIITAEFINARFYR